jgi:hypothetical protein
MKRAALGAVLGLLCAPVLAADLFQEIDERVLGNALEFLGTRDSDHFRSARLRAGLLVQHRSAYDFIALGLGGARYEQNDWSTERYTVLGAVRKTERTTGAGLVASLGLSQVDDHLRAVADATWNVRFSQVTGVELIGQRDFVETRAGLEAGTMTNFAAASVDHTVADRLTLVGLAGLQYFSDDNRRAHLRGRAIYVLVPEQGLAAQLRGRIYESSRPGGALYFNPENYEQGDIGLRLRRALGGHWRLLAAAGVGQERIERGESQRTYYVEARAERSFASDLWLLLSYVLDHSSGSDASSGADYKWQYFRAVMVMPF